MTLADVAMMVTVEVTGAVPEPSPPPLPPPAPAPPQPRICPRAAMEATSRSCCEMRRRFRTAKHTHKAKIMYARKGRGADRNAADWELAERVITVETAAPEGVTVAGLKEQVTPKVGSEQVRLIAELNPYCGVTVRFTVPDEPELIVSEAGEVPSVKFGAGALMTWRATEVFSVTPPLVPVTGKV
jgi:hypothetical protein